MPEDVDPGSFAGGKFLKKKKRKMREECVREETGEACMSNKSQSSMYLFSCSSTFLLFQHIFMNKASVSPKDHIVIRSLTGETRSLRESLGEGLKFLIFLNILKGVLRELLG